MPEAVLSKKQKEIQFQKFIQKRNQIKTEQKVTELSYYTPNLT